MIRRARVRTHTHTHIHRHMGCWGGCWIGSRRVGRGCGRRLAMGSGRVFARRASWGVRGLPRGSLSIYLSIPPDRRAARYARARRRHAGVQLHRTACARAVCKLLQPLHLRLVRVQRVRPGKRLRWTTEHSVWCTVHGGAPTPACPVACHFLCAELRRARSGATHKPATWKTAASARS